MNKIYNYILCLILILCNFTIIQAQQNLSFKQISTQDGLSQNTVRSILVDQKGFIWAGTLDGLVRYDGTRFINYKPKSGGVNTVSDPRIRSVKEDKNGFLWIKTYDNFYSCYNTQIEQFLKFRYEDRIRPLEYEHYLETPAGNIWLWGYKGCVKIEYNEEHIPEITYLISKENSEWLSVNITLIYEDNQQNTWIGTRNGLYKLNIKGELSSFYTNENISGYNKVMEFNNHIYFLSPKSILNYNISKQSFETPFQDKRYDGFIDLIPFKINQFLITTKNNKVVKVNIDTGSFDTSIEPLKNSFTSAPQCIVDKKNGLWLYDNSGKVQYYNAQNQHVKSFQLIREKIAQVIDDGRYNVLIDDESNTYWITTYGNGLYQYYPEADSLVNYANQKNKNSLASEYILSIAQDKMGNIWLGTEYAGMIKVSSDKYKFRYIKPEADESIGSSNNVKVIFEDSENHIWIGTKNGGLYIYDDLLNYNRCIIKSINPYTIEEDYKGRIWVGTKGDGIYLIDKHSYRVIEHFKHGADASTLCHNFIFDIVQDNQNRIWIATFGGGLDLLEESDADFSFKHFYADNGNLSYVRCIMQDDDGLIWLGTYGGLVCFEPSQLIKNPKSYTMYVYNSGHPLGLNCNDIKSIYEDHNKQIWVGTAGGGLNRLVRNSTDNQGEFKKFTKKEGLPSSIITGIIESKDSVLWVCTENGLAHLDKDGNTFVTYRFSKETSGNYYSENATLLLHNGTMLLGTLDGLLTFNPKNIKVNTKVPEVTLTDLYVFDQRVETYEEESPLTKSISVAKEVRLPYEQRTFTINFACLDLSDASQNKYSYKLEPYDEFWSTPSSNNWATYKNMPPGKYTFKVQGSNADGVWNTNATTCQFVVLPPLWKTWWAITIYFLAFIALTLVFIKFMLRISKLSSAVKIEKQLTDYKLRFFTNISHEFRTPLTLIKGAIERLSAHKNLPEEVNHHVNMLNRNTQQMSRLIDQLLEFRKLQNNILTLNLEKTDIKSFALDAYYAFKEVAFQKEIDYKFDGIDESYEFYLDRNKVEKILFNLLSNAFKFTPAKGKITCKVDVDKEAGECILSVIDTGIGIPEEKREMLFSRFMQINFSSEGTGVGLELVKEFAEVHKGKVQYKPNEGGGSVFEVVIPTHNEIYEDARYIEASQHTSSMIATEAKENEPIERPDKPHHWQLLIIDDNYDIRAYLKDELKHHFDIEEAADGKEGLEKAVTINPTLIICDVKMPEMDGLELTKRLKENFETSHIPVILLTAMSSETIKLKGSESGADAYIMKPFSMKYLLSRVYALIEQREKLKKRFSVDIQVKKGALSAEKKDQEFYDIINKIVDDNLCNPEFSVAQFTEKAKMSRTIFYKKVKGLTGYSPNELIKVKRMKAAAELLLEGHLNVSEVSWKVGIEDPFYFSKCFKAQFGCSPSKYSLSNSIEI